jgi:hypothetical protein
MQRVLNNCVVANKRADGQIFVGFWANENFAAKIDSARAKVPKSQFVRDSVAHYLSSKYGIKVHEHETTSPDRTGKGGPRQKSNSGSSKKRIVNIATEASRKYIEELRLKRRQAANTSARIDPSAPLVRQSSDSEPEPVNRVQGKSGAA